jgi:hypothetical protein
VRKSTVNVNIATERNSFAKITVHDMLSCRRYVNSMSMKELKKKSKTRTSFNDALLNNKQVGRNVVCDLVVQVLTLKSANIIRFSPPPPPPCGNVD